MLASHLPGLTETIPQCRSSQTPAPTNSSVDFMEGTAHSSESIGAIPSKGKFY